MKLVTYDIAAFRSVFESNNSQLLAQEFLSSQDGGVLITGINKLTQDVLMALFTIKGTKQYAPNDGCQFILDAQLGAWRTITDVSQSFDLSREDIAVQLQTKELSIDPPEELYGSMILKGVILSGTTVTVQIQVTNRAGESISSLIPFTVKYDV